MPAIGGSQPIGFQLLDHSNKRKSFEIFAGEITAISLPGFLTQLGAFYDAVNAVVLGVISREEWGERVYISNTPPASANAQNETEILVRYTDAVSEEPFSFRIPTADYAAFNWIGDDAILSGAGASAATLALIAAFEALGRSPEDETHGVNVVGIHVV